MKLKSLFLTITFLTISSLLYANAPVNGYVRDATNGETLIGATVMVKGSSQGTSCNAYGFYSLNVPNGKHTLVYNFIGYNPIEMEVDVAGATRLDVELTPATTQLDGVVVRAERPDANVRSTEMGTVRLSPARINQVPVMMGEADLVKAIQMLPGVQAPVDGASGFSVRGGAMDQNLVQLDEATIHNTTHLFGLFSTFNNDAVKDVKLYKGYLPPMYGGRLSSVLDVRMRDGNIKHFEGSAGIGTMASRITLEGPVVKDRVGVMASYRRSYVDLLFPLLSSADSSGESGLPEKLYFKDINAKANWIVGPNDRIYYSAYVGGDEILIDHTDRVNMFFQNITQTLRWNHQHGPSAFSNLTLLYSEYSYGMHIKMDTVGIKWDSDFRDFSAKYDYTWFQSSTHTIRAGAQTIRHNLNPGSFAITQPDTTFQMPRSQSWESAVYVSDDIDLDRFKVSLGLRYSYFFNVGKSDVYSFNDKYQVSDTTTYKKGEAYNHKHAPEPRIGITYIITPSLSAKASYSRTVQYFQQASTSLGGNFTDIWFSSSPNVKPQIGDQYSVGLFTNLFNNNIEVSTEYFYKDMRNQIELKDNASGQLNALLEGDLRFGKGRAQGIEVLIAKPEGRVSGWIGYTWSKATRTIDGINNGLEYPVNGHRPHDFTLSLSFMATQRVTLGANVTYKSGAPISFPVGRFDYYGTSFPIIGARNANRTSPYFRTDLSVTIKNRPRRLYHSEWVISVFNATNHFNPMMYMFNNDPDVPGLMKTDAYAFPIIPSINYNIKF